MGCKRYTNFDFVTLMLAWNVQLESDTGLNINFSIKWFEVVRLLTYRQEASMRIHLQTPVWCICFPTCQLIQPLFMPSSSVSKCETCTLYGLAIGPVDSKRGARNFIAGFISNLLDSRGNPLAAANRSTISRSLTHSSLHFLRYTP